MMPVSIVSKTRDELLIYITMLLALGTVFVWSLWVSPALRNAPPFIAFTGLMLIHLALHLISPRLTPRRRWLPLYFVFQGLLIFALNQLTSLSGMAIGLYLYLALAAQAIGLLSARPHLAVLVVAGCFALSVMNFAWLWGWAELPLFLVLATPQALIVIAFVVLFFRQASARRRAQELLRELETTHQQLVEYAAQVEDLTLATERQRLARELHDTLAQGLAGLILQLEAVDKQLTNGRHERAQTIVTQAMARARTTLADARRAIDDLRMGDRQTGDLGEAVRGEAERFTNATGVPCIVDASESEDIILPDKLHDHALRVVAEGLTNIGRHARASQAWVNIAIVAGALCISLRDNGIGFKPEEMNGRPGHYGLIGMQERARLAGGSLEIISTPEAGTTVTLHLPMQLENAGSNDV